MWEGQFIKQASGIQWFKLNKWFLLQKKLPRPRNQIFGYKLTISEVSKAWAVGQIWLLADERVGQISLKRRPFWLQMWQCKSGPQNTFWVLMWQVQKRDTIDNTKSRQQLLRHCTAYWAKWKNMTWDKQKLKVKPLILSKMFQMWYHLDFIT